MAALFDFISAANREFDRRGSDKGSLLRAREVFARVNAVLDIIPERGLDDATLAAWVEEQLRLRADARGRRDFAAADEIRKAIEAKGIVIEDAAGATRWKVVR